MNGHLFVIDGDLTRIACDAWLIPTDDQFVIEDPWRGCLKPHEREMLANRDGWLPGESAFPLNADPVSGEPWIWLGRIGTNEPQPGWYGERGAKFVELAAKAVREARLVNRAEPLD